MAHPAPYTSRVAVSLPDENTVRAVVGPSYDPDRTLNILKMFAGTDDMYGACIGFVKAVFTAQGVDPKVRQMIILRAAKVLNAPYEWQANVILSRNNGLSDDEIEAAATDGPVTGINEEYVLVCAATDEMSTSGTLTDETLQKLLESYGEPVVRKLILIISWFNLLSLFLNGCRVPLETTDKVGTQRSPLG